MPKKVPQKLVEEKKIAGRGGGGTRERRSAVKYETRFAEFEDEKASLVQGGHLCGPSGCGDSGLGRATLEESVALTARWGRASGLRKVTSAARAARSEPSLQGTRAGQAGVGNSAKRGATKQSVQPRGGKRGGISSPNPQSPASPRSCF